MPTDLRVLVTGGCGFIGSNFIRHALSSRPQWRLTNLDLLTYCGNRENLQDVEQLSQYTFVHGDINDRKLVDRLVSDCDAVVHFAAESHVDRSINGPRVFVETNVLGTQTLLDAAREAWLDEAEGRRGRFLHVSTDEVYGALPLEPSDARFTEESRLAPSSPYSSSKAASDMIVSAYHRTYGLDAVITRCSNNLGPYQYPEKIIPRFVTHLIEGRKAPLYGDGRYVRDWLHVEDHCEALIGVLEGGRAGETYNIGADNEHSNLELTRQILAVLGKDDSCIEHVDDRPAHDRRYALDSSKIRSEIGWRPSRSHWPEALERTIAWYVDNPDWWKRLKRE